MPILPSGQLSRRALLAGSAVLAGATVTGCDTGPDPGPAPTTSPAPVDPLAAVLARHVSLRDLYADAGAARPSLDPRLSGLRAEVEQHVAALAAAMAQRPPSAVTVTEAVGSSVGGSTGVPSDPPAPPEPAALLASLRQAEETAGAELAELVKTISAPRAPLIGSIAASCACHLVLLR